MIHNKALFGLPGIFVTVLLLAGSASASAAQLKDISNFRQYNKTFASAGQPSAKQLKLVARSGVDRVIYLAYSDNDSAIENEDRVVKELGMQYVHIPVDFEQPTLEDFQLFASVMQHDPDLDTLVHCQVNFRASTFSFLYRVVFLDVPLKKAKQDLDGVWQTNEVWYKFLRSVLAHYKIDHRCDGCDWGANEFSDPKRG